MLFHFFIVAVTLSEIFSDRVTATNALRAYQSRRSFYIFRFYLCDKVQNGLKYIQNGWGGGFLDSSGCYFYFQPTIQVFVIDYPLLTKHTLGLAIIVIGLTRAHDV